MAPALITDDLYKILEVEPTVNAEEIARSYKRLALKLHPDRNPTRDTTAAFQQLGNAYEVLKDEEQEIKALEHIANAEAAEESWKKISQSFMSLIYLCRVI
ncbi:DnaJ domain-containing protein [Xylariomycetidae sp. FL2044]|nr:DnaJ domain-containing protein [Xylariomycetidae sp. FL2044]